MFPSLDRVDWDLLHKQKQELIRVLEKRRLTESQTDVLLGIVYMLDGLQDDAATAGRWSFPGESKGGGT